MNYTGNWRITGNFNRCQAA